MTPRIQTQPEAQGSSASDSERHSNVVSHTAMENMFTRLMIVVTIYMRQQQQFMQNQKMAITTTIDGNPFARRSTSEPAATNQNETRPPALAATASSKVSLLVSQIPEFGGSEEENILSRTRESSVAARNK
ncbi:hypothetical protein EAI_15633 [Harpegnathos saltator]|uniref:Uncharacterized protein n=1 Tax=Harpegnathos saltator TaxID=610380 RepID=E2B4I4_HARSA|nr:hypothetical protein EAI_15633 [Harpegnathos saltator]